MRSRIILLGMVFLLPFGILHSQFDSVSLSDYKLPDIKRNQLDIQLNSRFNHSNQMPDKYLYMNGSGTFSMAYNSYTNRRNYQGDQTVSGSLNPYFYEYKQGASHTRSSSLQTGLNFSSVNRIYLQDLFFAEANLYAFAGKYNNSRDVRFYDAADSLTQRNKSDERTLNLHVRVPLLLGYGRIEPVEDARLAVYILEDMEKLGRLTRTPTREEIMELASLISTVKNERVLDSRIKKIGELKSIDAFLQQKGLITQADGTYFTSLNDNWDYSAGPVRYSGFRIYGGIEPSFVPIFNNTTNLNRDESLDTLYSDETESYDRELQINGLLGFRYNKPLSLSWQFACGADFYYVWGNMLNEDRLNDYETRTRLAGLQPRQYIQAGYYPDSRTYTTWRLSMNESRIKDYSWDETDEEWIEQGLDSDISLDFSWQFYYYISPRLRLSGTYRLFLSRGKYASDIINDSHDSMFSNDLSLGVNYSIF
ncbi:MAG: hypothetical protein U0T82_00850 [Bacteroidales bacterium]